ATNRKPLFDLWPKCVCITYHGMQKDLHVDSCQVKCGPLPSLSPPFVGIRVARSHSHSVTSFASESSIRDSMHVCNSATATGTSRTRFSPLCRTLEYAELSLRVAVPPKFSPEKIRH